MLQWHLLLEDFNPVFHYMQGPHNANADSLSRLGITPLLTLLEEKSGSIENSAHEETDLHLFDCLDCFLIHPEWIANILSCFPYS